MARIRTIKPEFWKHEQLGRLSMGARLTFVGLISMADDEGRGRADSTWLYGQLHAYSHPNTRRKWAGILSELRRVKDDDGPLVIFYKAFGAAYYWLPGFNRQQRIDEPSTSRFPAPPNSGKVPGVAEESNPLDREQGAGSKEQGGEQGGKSRKLPDSPPAVTPDGPEEDREVDATVGAFAFCNSPGITSKQNAIRDLRRMGASHEFIRSIAAKQEKKSFYDIIRSIEKGKAKPDFKASPPTPKRCRTCDGRELVPDLTASSHEKTIFKPCPDCGPPAVAAATG